MHTWFMDVQGEDPASKPFCQRKMEMQTTDLLVHKCAQISEITRFNHPNGLWGERSTAILSLCEGGGNSSDVTSGQCGPVLKHSIG